jgi:hypothetical protein
MKKLWAALILAMAAFASPVQAASSSVARAEALYADWLDAVSALATVDSGFTAQVSGRGHRAWAERSRELSVKLDAALNTLAASGAPVLTSEDARVIAAIRKGIVDNAPDVLDAEHPAQHCGDSARHTSDTTLLQVALYECFEEIGNRIDFDGRRIVRTTALDELQQLTDSERRKRLFLALSPLWIAVNGADTADSPYRRMMVLNGAEIQKSGSSPITNAAATLGVTPQQVEQWLVQILE